MLPFYFKDLLSIFGDNTHIKVEYLTSKYPIDSDIPFQKHCISSSIVEFYINDDAMEFPAWMLTSYVQYVCIDPDNSVRIYLYGIK